MNSSLRPGREHPIPVVFDLPDRQGQGAALVSGQIEARRRRGPHVKPVPDPTRPGGRGRGRSLPQRFPGAFCRMADCMKCQFNGHNSATREAIAAIEAEQPEHAVCHAAVRAVPPATPSRSGRVKSISATYRPCPVIKRRSSTRRTGWPMPKRFIASPDKDVKSVQGLITSAPAHAPFGFQLIGRVRLGGRT